MTDQTIHAIGIPSAEAIGVPTVDLRDILHPDGATPADYQRAIDILIATMRDTDPVTRLERELPAQAPRFIRIVDLLKAGVTAGTLIEGLRTIAEMLGVIG